MIDPGKHSGFTVQTRVDVLMYKFTKDTIYLGYAHLNPELMCRYIITDVHINLIINWSFEPRPKWPMAIWGRPKWPSATWDRWPLETFTTSWTLLLLNSQNWPAGSIQFKIPARTRNQVWPNSASPLCYNVTDHKIPEQMYKYVGQWAHVRLGDDEWTKIFANSNFSVTLCL